MAPLEIKTYTEFDKQLRFQMLLAEISTLFINLPADRIDSEIVAAQKGYEGSVPNPWAAWKIKKMDY